MTAFIVWACTGTTTGMLLIYELVFHGDNITADIKPIWGIASGTMLLVSGLVLYFFLVVQSALAEISGRHGR